MEEYPKPEQHWFDADKNSGSEPSRDWTEDFVHENGNYHHLCTRCNNSFKGHKRRWVCKVCSQPNNKPTKDDLLLIHEPPHFQSKKPTGILKDLSELKRYWIYNRVLMENENGSVIKVSDVEAIINKYMNP